MDTYRNTCVHAYTHKCTQAGIQTHTGIHTDRQAYIGAYIQADMHTVSQSNRQAGRKGIHTYTQRDIIQADRHKHI